MQNYKTGELTLEEVPVPSSQPGNVLVRTRSSLISSGTERGILELARKSLLGKSLARPDLFQQALDKARREGFWKTFRELTARMDTPTPLGYSCSGTVIEVGRGAEEFKVGDRVACMGAGYASHAEVVRVPRNLCALIPQEVNFDEAAFGMLGSIAMHGVRSAECGLGDSVAVIGLGLLGLLALQILKAAGCHVCGTDIDAGKVELARKLDPEGVYSTGDSWLDSLQGSANRLGADAVIVTAASQEAQPLEVALGAVRFRGTIVLVGTGKITLSRQRMWEKEARFLVSRASGPGTFDPVYELAGIDYPAGYVRWTERRNLEEFLSLVGRRRIQLQPLISRRFPISRALEAYELVTGGVRDTVGILLGYPEDNPLQNKCFLRTVPASPVIHKDRVGLGLIGAGLFARTVFLPVLARLGGVDLRGVATTAGASANHIARRFHFEYCTSDYNEVLRDPHVACVLIMTRHDSHARLIVEAWRAGKKVFVEKPLAISEAELQEIYAEWEKTHGFLMVGFNRRYSPLAIQVADFLPQSNVPRLIQCRVNAGPVAADHWVHDPRQGGGRIISEVCHFVDLAQFWTGSMPTRVIAERMRIPGAGSGEAEDIIGLLNFENGSLASVAYTASGHKAYSREQFEIFCGGRVAELRDFRNLKMVSSAGRKTLRGWSQKLGYKEELQTLIRGLRSGCSPVPLCEYLSGALATLRLRDSLRDGSSKPVDLAGITMVSDEKCRTNA